MGVLVRKLITQGETRPLTLTSAPDSVEQLDVARITVHV